MDELEELIYNVKLIKFNLMQIITSQFASQNIDIDWIG